MNALADRIRSVRARALSEATVVDRRATLTDAELLRSAEDLVRTIRAETDRARPVVAAVLPLATDALVLLTAAVLGDLTLCCVDPAAPEERRAAVLDALGPDVVVDGSGLRRSTGVDRDDLPSGYVAMSSGSTGGGPKGVLSSWSNIAQFVPHGAEALDLDEGSVWAEVSHLSYDLAMTNLLVALAAGSSLRLSSALGDRLRPLAFTEKAGATHLRLAPRFIELAVNERPGPGPRSLRVWGSGGDRLSEAGARQVFGLGVSLLVNTYGTSETIGFASAGRMTPDDELPSLHGTVTIGRGTVGPWHTGLHRRGDQDMLAIESPHLPGGYLFGSPSGDYPRWEGAGQVLTGDTGGRVGDDLFCLGRAGRRVKRSASFVDLDELDASVRERLGVSTYTTATASGELVSLVEGPEAQLEELRRRLGGVLRPDSVPQALVAVAQLPRLGNGKLDHGEAQRLALDADARRAEGD
ncbi:AMP-binding protein [Nocardioides sp. CER19]|uniref:AMP-binding protein n=1 Tax=Nocardioides sp. CER19 TaxID=3038538 RepID=UPI00244A17EC|nr:AMP-binding protein [Nocardioides sp. CER19]MDH2414834.1 AMP-binding protein [Nocardioides sp. CER19]